MQQGRLINEVVDWLRDHPEVTRVDELAAHVGVSERLGYADQAHFTHDFRTVTARTPGEYLGDQPGATT